MSDDVKNGGEPDGANRRTAKRVAVDYAMSVDVASGNMFYSGLIKDISNGGVFVATDKHHNVGDKLEVSFIFPGMTEQIKATGIVRWCRTQFGADEIMPEGVGLSLENLPPEVQKAINDYLKTTDVLIYEEDEEYSEW